MKYVTSSRRQIVMATLLGLAIVGAAMRYWAPNPSTARDIGTLMLVHVAAGRRQPHFLRRARMAQAQVLT